jgi:hypothetical protein
MRILPIVLALLLAATQSACGPVRPWVKPYERERLADRVMAWDRDPLATSYLEEVRQNREGARGGTGATGGGCGCN